MTAGRALGLVALFFVGACGCQPARSPGRQKGFASWYGPGFEGRRTASGEVFHASQLTAAHRTLPLGSEVEVVRLDEPFRVRVRINDRGPYADEDTIIDLSKGAGEAIHMIRKGRVPVEVHVVYTPPEHRSVGPKNH